MGHVLLKLVKNDDTVGLAYERCVMTIDLTNKTIKSILIPHSEVMDKLSPTEFDNTFPADDLLDEFTEFTETAYARMTDFIYNKPMDQEFAFTKIHDVVNPEI